MTASTFPSLRQRQREAARAHIAEAAVPLFLERGYAGTTTKAIAAAAGVSEGTVFNYFGSKQAVLLEALRRRIPPGQRGALDAIRNEVASLPDGGAAIRRFCDHDEEVAQRALPMVRVFLEAAAKDPGVAGQWRAQEEVRYRSQTWLLDVLASHGWLRTDVPREVLSRQLWLTVCPETRLKWEDAGLPVDDHVAWRETVLRGILLPQTRES